MKIAEVQAAHLRDAGQATINSRSDTRKMKAKMCIIIFPYLDCHQSALMSSFHGSSPQHYLPGFFWFPQKRKLAHESSKNTQVMARPE